MLILPVFKYNFTLTWYMSILSLCVISIFCMLGVWQLHRAEEKQSIIDAFHKLEHAPPYSWNISDELPDNYSHISLRGRFLPTIALHDNQHNNHQFGFHVLSPLQLSNGKIVLVNRGWVAGDITRQTFPRIESPEGEVQISGSTYYPSKKGILLGGVIEVRSSDLAIVERVDWKAISQFLQKDVYPFIMRLDPQENFGFVREWGITTMLPSRHYGYALQWFTMALVILILFISLNLKKKYAVTT